MPMSGAPAPQLLEGRLLALFGPQERSCAARRPRYPSSCMRARRHGAVIA